MEKFKKILGFENYEVSNYGNIKTYNWRNSGKEAILKPAKDKKGYLRVALVSKGKLITKKVHRLVAEAFIVNVYNKLQVNHINGIKHDNNANNLEWCTNSENQIHAIRTGLCKIRTGDSHHRTKYSDEFVKKINQELLNGKHKREIAREYKVDRSIFRRKILINE
jgi:hypothetical protein